MNITTQTEIEKALDISYFQGYEKQALDKTQAMLNDMFCYHLITKGTGILLDVSEQVIAKQNEERYEIKTFVFKENDTPCIDPKSFIEQISSVKWTEIIEAYHRFQFSFKDKAKRIFGTAIYYRVNNNGYHISRVEIIALKEENTEAS